ncbi:Mitochondrial intermediate peptidase [Sporothrix stenoceras]|uniref:Mitochondrial intermediate peptidase n=1 Tax=Sporothrix stenoceras TaxID=5173 RepID=A0ABR3Z7I0_9PEZI
MRQPRLTTIAAAALLLYWVGAASALSTTASTSTTTTSASTTPNATQTTHTTPTVYIASLAPTTGAAAATGTARNYGYQGCYLDISGMNGTAPGARSLQGDTTDEVLPGDMTVAKCLSFCGGAGSGTAYAYAGLEYARECWCGQELSSLATKEAEAQCNLPCDGDNNTLCGGDLRLTLYMLKSPATRPDIAFGAMAAVAGLTAVVQLL